MLSFSFDSLQPSRIQGAGVPENYLLPITTLESSLQPLRICRYIHSILTEDSIKFSFFWLHHTAHGILVSCPGIDHQESPPECLFNSWIFPVPFLIPFQKVAESTPGTTPNAPHPPLPEPHSRRKAGSRCSGLVAPFTGDDTAAPADASCVLSQPGSAASRQLLWRTRETSESWPRHSTGEAPGGRRHPLQHITGQGFVSPSRSPWEASRENTQMPFPPGHLGIDHPDLIFEEPQSSERYWTLWRLYQFLSVTSGKLVKLDLS